MERQKAADVQRRDVELARQLEMRKGIEAKARLRQTRKEEESKKPEHIIWQVGQPESAGVNTCCLTVFAHVPCATEILRLLGV